ncbi:phospholipase D family protein [Sulfurovum sp.]|uniref:phospholipase D family protein n=1 Tax=Sulfurovum sp. TaxID=1969726 RepID=UPI002867C88A|nr:phospholipase D family protein [Sulfurovum sp.]
MKSINFIYLFKIFYIVIITLFLSACSHKIPKTTANKQTSITKLPKDKAPLLSYLNNTDQKLGDHSAFYSLSAPTDAFAARLFLIDHATTSLDVQYYIYKADTTGKVFAAHLLMAAHRGVKVRILLDDLSSSGKDEQWQKLASHPNIELRLFNPNIFRTSFRNLALLFNVNSLGKRMHNKSLISDGSAAIIGGRNIGDVYFASTAETLFLDYDILAIGKVVPDIYKAFDLYWNSDEAVPSKDVLDHSDNPSYLPSKEDLKREIKLYEESPAGKAIVNSEFNRKLTQKNLKLTVAKRTDFYYDHPTKVNTDESDTSTHISAQLNRELMQVKNNLIVISPYFIPSDQMLENIKEKRDRGINVIVITNSLASTDVFPVYSGYQDSIKDLVEMGVKLYELKPNSFKKFLSNTEWASPNSLSLHTKMILMDNDRLIVGSANIDPRSDKLNTELLMIISSEKLTKRQKMELLEIINLDNFYQLSWGMYPNEFDNDVTHSGPIWHTLEEGKEKTYYAPPQVGFWKRLGTDMISILPIKGYL